MVVEADGESHELTVLDGLAQALGIDPTALVTDGPRWVAYERRGVEPRRLDSLRALERLLTAARRQAAALQEGAALRSLAEAQALAAGLVDLPGSAAWLGEVQLQLGVVAAQAGLPRLAAAALRRASTFDPVRHLRPAEAPPDVVAQGEAIRRGAATAPSGEFEVSSAVPGAQVFLDDVPQGAAPIVLRARVGVHVLRVEAPGQLAYGGLIHVFAGRRPPIQVALAPDPARLAVDELTGHARAGQYAALPPLLARLEALGSRAGRAWIFERPGYGERELLIECDSQGCRSPRRVLAGRVVGSTRGTPSRLSAEALARARRWLAQPVEPPQVVSSNGDGSLLTRWYIWSIAALGVGVAVTASLLSDDAATAPPSLSVEVDSGAVRR